MAVCRALCCMLSALGQWQQQRTCAAVSAASSCALAASNGTAVGRREPGGCRKQLLYPSAASIKLLCTVSAVRGWQYQIMIIWTMVNEINKKVSSYIEMMTILTNTEGELWGCSYPQGQFLPQRSSLCWSFPASPPYGLSLTITSTPSVSHVPSGHGVCRSRLVLILVSGDQVIHLLLPLGPKIQWLLKITTVFC